MPPKFPSASSAQVASNYHLNFSGSLKWGRSYGNDYGHYDDSQRSTFCGIALPTALSPSSLGASLRGSNQKNQSNRRSFAEAPVGWVKRALESSMLGRTGDGPVPRGGEEHLGLFGSSDGLGDDGNIDLQMDMGHFTEDDPKLVQQLWENTRTSSVSEGLANMGVLPPPPMPVPTQTQPRSVLLDGKHVTSESMLTIFLEDGLTRGGTASSSAAASPEKMFLKVDDAFLGFPTLKIDNGSRSSSKRGVRGGHTNPQGGAATAPELQPLDLTRPPHQKINPKLTHLLMSALAVQDFSRFLSDTSSPQHGLLLFCYDTSRLLKLQRSRRRGTPEVNFNWTNYCTGMQAPLSLLDASLSTTNTDTQDEKRCRSEKEHQQNLKVMEYHIISPVACLALSSTC
jgi:hypothetical protein